MGGCLSSPSTSGNRPYGKPGYQGGGYNQQAMYHRHVTRVTLVSSVDAVLVHLLASCSAAQII